MNGGIPPTTLITWEECRQLCDSLLQGQTARAFGLVKLQLACDPVSKDS